MANHRQVAGMRRAARRRLGGRIGLVGLTVSALVACSNASTTAPYERPAQALFIRGTVVTASGYPAAGVSVRSRGFQTDCTTPIFIERDTLLTTDASGAFHGFLRTLPNVTTACVTLRAERGDSVLATQSVQVVFRGSVDGRVDTATARLELP